MLAWMEGQNDELSCCVFKTICFSRGGGMSLLQKNMAHTHKIVYTHLALTHMVFLGPIPILGSSKTLISYISSNNIFYIFQRSK